MSTILFPTDFSKIADNAFIYCLQFAAISNQSINVLHVYHRPDISGVNLPNTLQEVYDSIDIEEFENFRTVVPKLHTIAKEYNMDHLTMNHLMIEGEVVPTIQMVAKKEDANLIIMGTKGASGLKEIFLGSVTAKVIEESKVNVLSIPEEASFDGLINNFVFVTDYRNEDKEAFNQLIQFAEPFSASIRCVHFDMDDEESIASRMTEWKNEFSRNADRHVFESIDSDQIEESLSAYCKEYEVDVVAITASKNGLFKKWFGFSLSRQLTYHVKMPLLTIHV